MVWPSGMSPTSTFASSSPTYHSPGASLINSQLSYRTNQNLYPPASSNIFQDYGASFSSNRQSSLAKAPLVRPVHFRSANVASSPSANIRWATPETVNFMDHLYFLTNLVLDYLLKDSLPQEFMNQTLLDDPRSVLMDHRNELIAHFHKLLIAACACLCIGISIPLFGFMIACCWCGSSNKSSTTSKRSTGRHTSRSGSRSRSRNNHRDPSDADWLALASREHHNGSSSRHHRDGHRRRRHGRGHHRSQSGNGGAGSSSMGPYRSRSMPPSLRYESSCHPCLRTFFSSNLFMILLLVAFFTVCAFVTNEYVSSGVKQFPIAVNQSLDSVQSFLNNTDYEVDNLFRVNYNQLESELTQRLDTSGMIIKHKLAISSEAIALANLTDIVMEFEDTKVRLEKLDRELSTLKSRLSTARTGLADIKAKILKCPADQCALLRKRYGDLEQFRIYHHDKLPDLKNLIKKVSQLIDSGVVTQVQQGKEEFERYARSIQSEVNKTSPEIKAQLNKVGRRLSAIATEVSQSIRSSDALFNQTRMATRKMAHYVEHEQYRRYAGLGGAFVILFILICYVLGWLHGSCRPQPTSRTYKTRVKTSASASFPFTCGIFVVFLVFLPMILAAIVLFLTGSVGDKIVCQVIKNPDQMQSKQIYAMLQNKFISSNLAVNSPDEDKLTVEQNEGKELKIYVPNYADLLSRCHKNMSIYRVLKLDQYDRVSIFGNSRKLSLGLDKNFNLSSTPEFRKIDSIDGKMRDLIKNTGIDLEGAQLLSAKAESILQQFMDLSFDDLEMSFARLYENGPSISPINIEQLTKDLTAQKASVNPDYEADLSVASLLASSLSDQLLPNITSSLLNLKEGVRHLKLRMFHGKKNFGNVIGELIAKVRSAEKQLHNDGRTLITNAANEFIDELNALIDQYSTHVRYQVDSVIGQCEPLSRTLNATSSALCDDIILPFNGYWLSITASLILILPATFLAYALRGLYKLAKKGPYLHHNYSYTDQEDDLSYEDEAGEEIALAYRIGHHGHLSSSNKPSSSSAVPSAPIAGDDRGWSPSSPNYVHNSRPPPYAV